MFDRAFRMNPNWMILVPRLVEVAVEVAAALGEDLAVDDFVVVHVGYAIQKITPQEAQTAWELYDQMLASEQREEA